MHSEHKPSLEPVASGKHSLHEVPEGLNHFLLAKGLCRPIPVQLQHIPQDLSRHQQHIRSQ